MFAGRGSTQIVLSRSETGLQFVTLCNPWPPTIVLHVSNMQGKIGATNEHKQEGIAMSIAVIWIVVGILLIISELLATSIVAVFFGIAALVVGVLLKLGLIESYSAQFLWFGVVSVVTLLLARERCKRWFVGFTADTNEQQGTLSRDIGDRVVVHSDFDQGAGRVVLNGVQWDAQSADTLKAGDVAWVTSNNGIQLTVSKSKPA